MSNYKRIPQKITFEAEDILFAEFISFRQTQTNAEFVGYFIQEKGWFDYYIPIREPEAILHYKAQLEALQSENKRLSEKVDTYYTTLKNMGKINELGEPKESAEQKNGWFKKLFS